MTANPVCLRLSPERLLYELQSEALALLQSAESDVTLDLSEIVRVDAAALGALERLVSEAEQKSVRIILRSVNPNVFKTLLLLKIVIRFTFQG